MSRVYTLDDYRGLPLETLVGKFNTRLFSSLEGQAHLDATRYFTRWLAHPDRDYESGRFPRPSEFGQKMGFLKYLFRFGSVSNLLTNYAMQHKRHQNYDALLLYDSEGIAGHAAYQMHGFGKELHMFSVFVDEKYKDGEGNRRMIAIGLLEALIEIARKNGIEIMRFGRGNNAFMNPINDSYFRPNEQRLGIRFFDTSIRPDNVGYFHVFPLNQ